MTATLRTLATGVLVGTFCLLAARQCAVQAQDSLKDRRRTSRTDESGSQHRPAAVGAHSRRAQKPSLGNAGRSGAATNAAGRVIPAYLTAARACWLEASWSTDDCTAVLYVLMRRAQRAEVPVDVMAWRYTALRAATPRAELARQLPDGDERIWSRAENRQWSALRAHARAVLEGRVINPCPGADHWGGLAIEADRLRALAAVKAGRWRAVRCRRPTANAFYAERGRR